MAVVFDGGAITSNAGALLHGATDRAINLVSRFAACFRDARAAERIEHAIPTLIGQRVFGIVLGDEDVVDHDLLRRDPVLAGKLEARRAGCAPLPGKSTLNRLEHAPVRATSRYHRIGNDVAAIEASFVDLFLDAQPTTPPTTLPDGRCRRGSAWSAQSRRQYTNEAECGTRCAVTTHRKNDFVRHPV